MIKVDRKNMRDVNVRERETWNESERLGDKRERKRERERETYERIQGMRKKKSYKESLPQS